MTELQAISNTEEIHSDGDNSFISNENNSLGEAKDESLNLNSQKNIEVLDNSSISTSVSTNNISNTNNTNPDIYDNSIRPKSKDIEKIVGNTFQFFYVDGKPLIVFGPHCMIYDLIYYFSKFK